MSDFDLIERIKGQFASVTDEKARDAIAVFGAKWVDLVLTQSEGKAKHWNYCLTVLKGWQSDGGPPEPKRRKEPKRLCDERYERPKDEPVDRSDVRAIWEAAKKGTDSEAAPVDSRTAQKNA